MDKLRHWLRTRKNVVLLGLVAILAILKALYPVFNRPLPNTYFFGTVVDQWLPFAPAWIIFYVAWYPYLPGVLLLLWSRDKRACALALAAQIMGVATCYFMYSLFQTTVPRPELGTDVFCRLVGLIYAIDQPYNAFPSIHALGTFALALATARAKGVARGTKMAVVGIGLLIILSTVFVKQHVVVDIVAGVAVAGIFYFVSDNVVHLVAQASLATEQEKFASHLKA